MFRKILICFLLLIQYTLSAQDWQNVRFSALTLQDGLSQLSTTVIFQDSQGLMWFGTRDGLNSYDGKSFRVYRPNQFDNRIDNHIIALCEDADRNLWIGTINGLMCMEYNTGKFITYLNDKRNPTSLSDNYILALNIDTKDQIIVGTKSGFNVFNKSTNTFTTYFFDRLLKDNPVQSLCVSKDGSIYIATASQGLLQIDSDFNLINQFKIDNRPIENQINVVFEDKSGLIWFGGNDIGLCVLNPGSKTLQRFTINDGLEENNIRAIEDDGKGNLIIGTFNGLYLFNKASSNFTPFSALCTFDGEINHYSIMTAKFDKAGTLWVGTYAGGISYYHRNNKKVNYYNPAANNKYTGILGMLIEDKNRNIWIASEGSGLINWNPKSSKFTYHRIEPVNGNNYSRNIIKSLFYDGTDIYCGTTHSEIYRFDTKTLKFKFLYKLKGGQRNVVYSLLKDNEGNLWAGALSDKNGLYRIDKNGQLRTVFTSVKNTNFTFNNVRSLLLLRQNVLLVGTHFDGLFMLDYAQNIVTPIPLLFQNEMDSTKIMHITSIFRDSKNRIWIGTYGKGVYCYTENDGVIAHYNKKSGLIDDDVCSIIESDSKNIWIATKNSLSELNLSTSKITNYNNKNGTYLYEMTHRAAFKSSDGHLYFSGSNGFISFYPQNLNSNNYIPPVIFTSFSVNNMLIDVNDSSKILTQNLNTINEIKLNYKQSNLSISFAALNYIFPEHNSYSIMLEGVDHEWINNRTRNEVNYANLAPGNYTFKVKAANNDGLWNEKPIMLKIYISPPFWKTWWAYSFYFLIVITAFVVVLYYLNLKHDLEARIALKQLEKEKSDEFHKERIQLFTNFSHEMRTPLTMIITPLINLIDNSELLSPLYKESLQLMQKNANRLMLLVNQLMDFQKTESGKMKLSVSEMDMVDFLLEVYLSFNELAKSKKIIFTFDNPYQKLPAFFDENLIEKVCFNLIFNAFKFSKENAQVKLGLKMIANSEKNLFPKNVQDKIKYLKGDLIMITIEDNGLGISEENLKDIFKPFYQVQTSANKTQSGSGIGLSLTKSIVKLSHGAVWVTSEINKGTTFNVLLPVSKENFKEDEISSAKISYTVEEQTELPTFPLKTKNQTVLVIDDDDDIRKFLSSILSTSFKVLTAADGKQGFDIAIAEMPDLVLCDVIMPHITGIELCKKLKENIKTGHIPIILITSQALSMQIQEGFNAGADEYITKPFRTSHLLQKINTLLLNRERLKSIYNKKFSLESLGFEIVSSDERFMTRISEIIQENFSNHQLDIDFIANELGMSRTNLYRKVKSLTNLSTIDLIINIRLLTAKRMLLENDLSIAETAYLCGFNSPAYFTTSFKKQYGITPKEVIDQYKNAK